MKRLEDELGPLLNKLNKKLKRQMLEMKKRKALELEANKWFSEIGEKIIVPIMIEYKKFLETKEEPLSLHCAIEKSYQIHGGITFELKDSIPISKHDAVRRVTFFPKKDRVHILRKGR